jgi:hypothetical protein
MATESTVYILGAGASREAGLPLTTELVNLIIDENRKLPLKWFLEPADVDTTREFINGLIKSEALLRRSGLNPLNVEEILNLASTAELLEIPLPYPNRHLIEGRIVREYVTWLILLVLESLTRDRLPASYRRFAKLIRATDSIITLNYDLVVESFLRRRFGCFNYCLGLQPEQIESPSMRIDEGVHLLKLHGSINWRECTDTNGSTKPPCGKFFIYEAHSLPAYGYGVARVCNCGIGSLRTKIIPPVFLKLSTDAILRSIWRTSVYDLRKANRLIIIGYSLPSYDVAVQEMIRLACMANQDLEVIICNPDLGVRNNYKFLEKRGFKFYDVPFSGVVDLLEASSI